MSTPADLSALAEAWEELPALDVLLRAVDLFAPRLTLATAFGAEGCVLVDLVGRHRLPIDLFTLDTGLFFPETVALWRTLEARYGLAIRAVRPARSVDAQATALGPALWRRDPDRCCAERKLAPLGAELGRFAAWVTAIRRAQTAERASVGVIEWDARFGLPKINPLARWSTREVWEHLRAHDVPSNPLHELGYASIGCAPCTSPVGADEDARAGRWRGRAKTECGLHLRTARAALPPPSVPPLDPPAVASAAEPVSTDSSLPLSSAPAPSPRS